MARFDDGMEAVAVSRHSRVLSARIDASQDQARVRAYPPAQAFFYRTLERLVAPLTDVFINVGKEMRDECLKARIGNPDRHVVIPSGMDLTKFSKDLRKRIRWSEVFDARGIGVSNPRFVLLVSRLEERKGQLEFL